MQNEMPIDQLVTEMNHCIAAVTTAETVNTVVPRFNQLKTVAYLDAEFRVHDDIPEELKQGIFAQPVSYPVKLRFANATNRDDSKKDIRGLSMQLSAVEGSVLWGMPGKQDFILNSHPVLFVATPEDFLEFIRARQQGKFDMLLFLLTHLKSLCTVIKSRKKHLSPLDIRYWSTVPFRLGEQVVKYSVIPCSDYQTTEVVEAGENQLRAAIKAHLQKIPGRFHFAVQLQTDPESMPIEDASVVWDEAVSPFIPVATLTLENQDVDNPDALANGERCSFNPWQCLPAHAPLGRMNQVRRLVYAKAAELRNNYNNKESHP
jgi:catalase